MNQSDDEKRLISIASNLVRLSEKRYAPCYSDFLSESERLRLMRLSELHSSQFEFWGGYEDAERTVLCVYPEYGEPAHDDYPFELLCVKFRKTAKLSHRDFLGALMSLGIKREALGDIVIAEGMAAFFVKAELAPYIRAQIETVGREGVTFVESKFDFSFVTKSFEQRSCTVSSLRLDAVVGECVNVSRTKAQQLVKSGAAAVNAQIVYDGDHRVNDGDKLSVRGFGKYIIRCDGTKSKKGKLRITIMKYK